MTRINLVPPSELMDQHLFAEFREIKMIPRALLRSLNAISDQPNGVLKKIPKQFCLGTGHVTFFYDKGLYLDLRYHAIRCELALRGVAFNRDDVFDSQKVYHFWPMFYNDFQPTMEDIRLIRERIAERIAQKPHWYRYYGVPNDSRI